MSDAGRSDRIFVLAERYLEERSSVWAPSTLENQSRGLRFFTDFMRAEGRSFSTADVLAFACHVRERKTVRGAPWAERSIEWALTASRSFLR